MSCQANWEYAEEDKFEHASQHDELVGYDTLFKIRCAFWIETSKHHLIFLNDATSLKFPKQCSVVLLPHACTLKVFHLWALDIEEIAFDFHVLKVLASRATSESLVKLRHRNLLHYRRPNLVISRHSSNPTDQAESWNVDNYENSDSRQDRKRSEL